MLSVFESPLFLWEREPVSFSGREKETGSQKKRADALIVPYEFIGNVMYNTRHCEPVVLRAANQNPNDCQWQSYHNVAHTVVAIRSPKLRRTLPLSIWLRIATPVCGLVRNDTLLCRYAVIFFCLHI